VDVLRAALGREAISGLEAISGQSRLRIVSRVGEQLFAFFGLETIDGEGHGIPQLWDERGCHLAQEAFSSAKAVSMGLMSAEQGGR